MKTKFANQQNPKIKWLILCVTILGFVGGTIMVALGIKKTLINDNDNTALWVVGLIISILSLIFFIKAMKKVINFYRSPTVGEAITGDNHA
ncbi:MAG: hypothetical protein LBF00_02240 [Mycoplasmataceae bacterium]|nr:hypothetical protein [Mycoplasmataceae bacterium]